MKRAAMLLLTTVFVGVAAAGWAVSASAASEASDGSRAEAPSAGGTMVVDGSLTLDGANAVLAAALARAKERGAGGAVAVVDPGGHLLALQRLDGTFAAGADVSIGKARTAALFRKPTRAFEESINAGRTALAAVREMTPLIGGVPVVVAGRVVGGVGVSGAHNQQEDEELALAGAAAVAGSAIE